MDLGEDAKGKVYSHYLKCEDCVLLQLKKRWKGESKNEIMCNADWS